MHLRTSLTLKARFWPFAQSVSRRFALSVTSLCGKGGLLTGLLTGITMRHRIQPTPILTRPVESVSDGISPQTPLAHGGCRDHRTKPI